MTAANRAAARDRAARVRSCLSRSPSSSAAPPGGMGRLLVGAGRARIRRCRVAGAVEAPGHPAVGRDAGELAGAPAARRRRRRRPRRALPCRARRDRLHGARRRRWRTRGSPPSAARRSSSARPDSTPSRTRELRALRAPHRAVIAANMSVGVTVLTELVALAGAPARPELRRRDRRAPSPREEGRAERHGARARSRGRPPRAAATSTARVRARARGTGRRAAGRTRSASSRSARGDAVGDHTVLFGGLGERLELTHRAQSRDCLARGALRGGAMGGRSRPAGIHSMRDVLGLA